ncbi:hypothetical protein KUCAC02_029746, partial [Chaenocephalus aceratus]
GFEKTNTKTSRPKRAGRLFNQMRAISIETAVVHIQVNDVNEFAPVFRESEYRAAVTEGKIYDSILQVEATDQDCSPQYSQICNYQISSTNTPFAIDRN